MLCELFKESYEAAKQKIKKCFKIKPVVEHGSDLGSVTVPPPPCKHDWEIIKETYDICYIRYGCETGLTGLVTKKYTNDKNEIDYYKEKEKKNNVFTWFAAVKPAQNKVCMKCGECYNGIELYKKEIEKQKQKKINEKIEKQKRKELAKKMWEEGSNGS